MAESEPPYRWMYLRNATPGAVLLGFDACGGGVFEPGFTEVAWSSFDGAERQVWALPNGGERRWQAVYLPIGQVLMLAHPEYCPQIMRCDGRAWSAPVPLTFPELSLEVFHG